MNCRHCQIPLKHTFLDLGNAPPSNAYLSKEDLNQTELYFTLKIKVCDQCWLVQTEDYTNADTFLHQIMHIFQALQVAFFYMLKISLRK